MMTVVSFILVLSILVIIHEWGHFIVARRNGVRIKKFSVGFGPIIFRKKIDDTEYVISVLPLGGFIKMAGENADEIENLPDEFASKTLWQRTKIVFAGPFMNIFMAFVIMPLAYWVGTEVPVFINQPAKIGWIDETSAAQKLGIQVGDIIKSINHQETNTWNEVFNQIGKDAGANVEITIQRGNELKIFHLLDLSGAKSAGGSVVGIYPEMTPVVKQALAGFPAEKAGIKSGDKLLSINGIPITHLNQFLYYLKMIQVKEIQLVVDRKGALLTKTLTPVFDEKNQKVVIGASMAPETEFKQFGLMESIINGFSRTWHLTLLSFDVLKQLFSMKLSLRALGGPISIAQSTGQAARMGLGPLLGLMAFISLQLGIMNLLPIPVLDGGWLLFFGIEAVLQKPLNRNFILYAQVIGFSFLFGLIILVTYQDLLRLFK